MIKVGWVTDETCFHGGRQFTIKNFKDARLRTVLKNIIYVGVIAELFKLNEDSILQVIAETFKKNCVDIKNIKPAVKNLPK